MGGGGPVWQEEEGSTIPWCGELLPPLEVEEDVPGEGDDIVLGGNRGAGVNYPSEEGPSRWDHLGCKLRVPIRDSSSRLEQLEWVAQVSREGCMSWSLSGGMRASSEAESRGMPRYSRQVVGLSHLSSASGTPRAAQRETRVCRCCEHCSELGVQATKKSGSGGCG